MISVKFGPRKTFAFTDHYKDLVLLLLLIKITNPKHAWSIFGAKLFHQKLRLLKIKKYFERIFIFFIINKYSNENNIYSANNQISVTV